MAGALLTAASFAVAALSLIREFRWRRRQYALDMMRDWSTNTAPHRDALEREYPGLFDDEEGVEPVRLPIAEAERIFRVPAGANQRAEVKRHVIELLNYCEFIAVAYARRVAHRSIIEESFRGACLLLHDRLHPYIEVSTQHRRGRNPWAPFCDLADRWSVGKCATQHRKAIATSSAQQSAD